MQTIEQALRSPAIRRALAGYHGVADQPSAETAQRRQDLLAAVPLRSERSYTVTELLGRALEIVGGRYQVRADLPRLPEPETAEDVAERMRETLEESLRPGYHKR